MDEDDYMPEFAKIIDAMNEELFDERKKYESEIKTLETNISNLTKKYEPDINTTRLIHKCYRNVNHNNIAKVIHSLNKGNFKCKSLKKREWLYKKDNIFIPMENEIFVKRMIDDSLIVFLNEIRKIEAILENEPEHLMYDFYAFSYDNCIQVIKSLDSPRTKSFIIRELRELFYES